MNEKETIIVLIDTHPKHYSKMVRTRDVLWEWVKTHSKIVSDNTAAMIYSAIHQVDDQCKYGNTKKFSGRSVGFTSCGPTGKCQCAKEAVSASVSANKATRTQEQILAENTKREQTSLKKYGVTNNAQTEQAKNAHREFYADPINVVTATTKNKLAKIKNHGQATYNNRAKAKETTLIKYGVENPMQNKGVLATSIKTRKQNYDPLSLFANNYNKFVVTVKEEYGVDLLTPVEEYHGVATRPIMTFKCLKCDFIFDKRFDYGAPPICKCCNPTERRFQSKEELEVLDYIRSIYPGNILSRDRTIINPYELDIVIPDRNLAIEYCGIYWHSEISGNKTWNYHERKMKLANARGLRLITIFSDEWLTKKEQVKRKLQSVLSESSIRIGARKCVLKLVSLVESRNFHNVNHIQSSPARLGKNIGLYHNDQLVALGSFVKRGNSTTYELVRFSSSMIVVGGASKIIRFFSKITPDAEYVVSFADLRWSEGDMYLKIGFQEIGRVPVMQYYTRDGSRYHKRMFTKRRINSANDNVSEWQRMQEIGYDRIWDCGKIKFQISLK